MEVELSLKKSAYENASDYFERSKKSKEKLAGARRACAQTRAELEQAEKEQVQIREPKLKEKKERKWYEKFRHFQLDDFLVLAGKDATTNEILIKKHTSPDDVVFHADITGAAFTVIKTEGKPSAGETPEAAIVPEEILGAAATLSACYSKAWSAGLSAVDVYWVKPEQVSKTAPAGEFIGKGAFMIYGRKNYFHKTKLELAIGIKENRLIAGSEEFVRPRADKTIILIPGREHFKELCAKITKKLGKIDFEELQRIIPSGKGELK